MCRGDGCQCSSSYVINRSFIILKYNVDAMDVFIDFEFLKGLQNDIVVKELSLAAKNASGSFRFKSPYTMVPHGSEENGLNL